ncbi:TonB-dependent receptor [Duganella sp. FT50W]|uniref:TonB-dependent receptor n=1 Tax=Duganella lactea TaxID=2692173 RepID=A0A6L8MNB8_9BURK|nr:TonB-dependent receptor [Duganella lactea]MYM83462.1 TonB-dependent receptor [Duganella lactea]
MTHHTGFKPTATAAAVAALLASISGAALAQTTPPEDNRLQEVIVTAQRIAQPASKTPLSLSVVSGDDLKQAGAVNASSLTELVPNVQVSNNGGATTISIRGVSSADNTEKGDPSASFNVDGVNLARPQSAGLAFYDLERVEVLRGPQGTLYGRNATAGAINLITNKPSNRFESSAAVEVGNYHGVKFDGMLNVKVSDMLSLRTAVSTSKHDGYLRSTQGFSHNYDDDDSQSARVHALFKFNPDVSLLLSGDTSRLKGAGAGSVPYATFVNQSGDAQRTATPSIQGKLDDSAHGTSGELKVNTRAGEITYQLARRTLNRDEYTPFGQSTPGVVDPYTRVLADYSQLSHELRLASMFGKWKTIGGLYWFKEQSALDVRIRNFPALGVLAFIQNPTISASKAAFGEATYSLTPELHLIAGVRRTKDDKSRQGFSQYGDPVFFSSVNDADVHYVQTTGRLGADYALSKAVMVYGTFATGYKAGGFNDGTAATNRFLRYDPEHLKSLEVGLKGRFLDNRLQVSTAAFTYDYKDLQLTGVAVDPATGALQTQTLNAGQASVRGLEVEGKYAVGSAGKINFSLTTLDAHFKTYSPLQGVNWAGKRLEKSPRATFGLGYSHTWNFEEGASLTAYLGTRFSSSYVLNDYGNAKQFTQGSFHKSDFNLNYAPSDFRWSLQAYVRNIEDKTVMTGYGAPSGNRPDTANLAPPRTMGVRVGVNF